MPDDLSERYQRRQEKLAELDGLARDIVAACAGLGITMRASKPAQQNAFPWLRGKPGEYVRKRVSGPCVSFGYGGEEPGSYDIYDRFARVLMDESGDIVILLPRENEERANPPKDNLRVLRAKNLPQARRAILDWAQQKQAYVTGYWEQRAARMANISAAWDRSKEQAARLFMHFQPLCDPEASTLGVLADNVHPAFVYKPNPDGGKPLLPRPIFERRNQPYDNVEVVPCADLAAAKKQVADWAEKNGYLTPETAAAFRARPAPGGFGL